MWRVLVIKGTVDHMGRRDIQAPAVAGSVSVSPAAENEACCNQRSSYNPQGYKSACYSASISEKSNTRVKMNFSGCENSAYPEFLTVLVSETPNIPVGLASI